MTDGVSIAAFYLVIEMATLSPLPNQSAFIGPMSQEECEQAVKPLSPLPAVLNARCRRMVGAMTCPYQGNPAISTACPIFEGDVTSPVGINR